MLYPPINMNEAAANGGDDEFVSVDLIGQRLSESRKGRFTIRELSEASGVSAGLISQIERGTGNPSFRTLHRITETLDLRIGDLFDSIPSAPKASASVVREGHRKHIQLGSNGLVWELLTPNLQGQLEMLLTRIPPGFTNEQTPFRHSGEECVLILDGDVELMVGDQLLTLATGDSVTYDSSQQHWWRNTTESDVVVVGAVTPPSF